MVVTEAAGREIRLQKNIQCYGAQTSKQLVSHLTSRCSDAEQGKQPFMDYSAGYTSPRAQHYVSSTSPFPNLPSPTNLLNGEKNVLRSEVQLDNGQRANMLRPLSIMLPTTVSVSLCSPIYLLCNWMFSVCTALGTVGSWSTKGSQTLQ